VTGSRAEPVLRRPGNLAAPAASRPVAAGRLRWPDGLVTPAVAGPATGLGSS
jgi:hypothetical protein